MVQMSSSLTRYTRSKTPLQTAGRKKTTRVDQGADRTKRVHRCSKANIAKVAMQAAPGVHHLVASRPSVRSEHAVQKQPGRVERKVERSKPMKPMKLLFLDYDKLFVLELSLARARFVERLCVCKIMRISHSCEAGQALVMAERGLCGEVDLLRISHSGSRF